MEKFLVTGHSKATESESCKQFRLSLPIAKRYEPHIVKKGEEQLYPLDIINMAVYRKKYVLSCVQCSQDVLDHQISHLVYHTRCRFCRFEMRPFEHQSIRWLEDYKQACLNLTRRDAGTCSVCFLLCQDNDKYARKKHEETLHEGKPKQYKCEKCTKSFSNSIALSYHQAKHDNEVTRDTCDLCGSKFSSDGTLLRHKQLVHSEMPAEPEYVCLECGIKFSRKDNLNRHRKENHYDASKANYDC